MVLKYMSSLFRFLSFFCAYIDWFMWVRLFAYAHSRNVCLDWRRLLLLSVLYGIFPFFIVCAAVRLQANTVSRERAEGVKWREMIVSEQMGECVCISVCWCACDISSNKRIHGRESVVREAREKKSIKAGKKVAKTRTLKLMKRMPLVPTLSHSTIFFADNKFVFWISYDKSSFPLAFEF